MIKNKITVTLLALCLSLYGLVGFWSNLGNEEISPILFASIVIASIIAFVLIIVSAYILTKERVRKQIIKNSIICLVAALICFAVFVILLINSNRIGIGKLYTLINGTFFAFGTISIVYTVSFMLLSISKK